jgi:hypothetical protein
MQHNVFKVMDFTQYALAARLEPLVVPHQMQRLLFCYATAPQGFLKLQNPPLSLTKYAAARLVHKAIATRNQSLVSDVYESYRQNNQTANKVCIDGFETLQALFVRAGVADQDLDAAVSLSLWHPDTQAVVDILCTPYPSLRRIIVAEIASSKDVAWRRITQ